MHAAFLSLLPVFSFLDDFLLVFSIVFDMILCQHFFLFVNVLGSCGWQQLLPWHSNELAAARRVACRVGPPGSCFVSDDILIKQIFLDGCDQKGRTMCCRPLPLPLALHVC